MTAADQRLEAFAKRLTDWYFKADPFTATLVGRHEFDTQVPDLRPRALKAQVDKAKEFLRELERMNVNELSPDGQIDYRILQGILRQQIRSYEVLKTHEKNPGSVVNAAMGVAYVMMTRDYAPRQTRMRNLFQRLSQIDKVFKQSRESINNPPRIYTEIAIQQTEAAARFLGTMRDGIAQRASGPFASMMLGAFNKPIKAFDDHLTWLKELLPKSNGEFAVGEAVFTEMLQADHLLDYTAETLLAKGWEIFKDTQDQLESLSKDVDPARTWQEILAEQKGEHPTAEDLLPAYREELIKVKEFVLEKGIVDIPAGEKLIVQPTPPFQRAIIPYAAYMPPAPFEEQQVGIFWVTTPDPNSSPEEQAEKLQGHSNYKIPVTTLHEAYPGHHLQLVWANKAATLARKLSHSTLFAEGWAFYCEELMEELGYISEPRVKLARLKDQLWRAARIIIDVSIHTGRMSVDEAVSFLVEQAHLEPSNALAEVRRYTMSPTQPMSYLIGKLEILKIVEDYKAKQGEAFDLKTFHNELLSFGSIPPALVRRAMLG